jgi:hypothetical protein
MTSSCSQCARTLIHTQTKPPHVASCLNRLYWIEAEVTAENKVSLYVTAVRKKTDLEATIKTAVREVCGSNTDWASGVHSSLQSHQTNIGIP